MRQVESSTLSQRLIHGEVRTELWKVAVGAFVLANVCAQHGHLVSKIPNYFRGCGEILVPCARIRNPKH